MPVNRFRLTGLVPTSKLFFTASHGVRAGGTRREAPRELLENFHKSVAMMKKLDSRNHRGVVALIMILAAPALACAQPSSPGREQLLNGLTILFSPRPGDPQVLLKLRIHSGAAFDLAGKAGTMSLLADSFFPDAATHEYVTEELGGKLEVVTTYDGIDVILSGKAGEFERMIELLRNAVITPNLSADSVARVRQARLKQLADRPLSAAEVADEAVAARLFGTYPYAHSPTGTAETLAKIDRADLLLARERFIHPDNATLVVSGGVEKARVMRDLRQLLGPWQKGDRSIPATFRQASPPDPRVLLISQPGSLNADVRIAVRGFAARERDSLAASLLS